jgi:hypothetical protein
MKLKVFVVVRVVAVDDFDDNVVVVEKSVLQMLESRNALELSYDLENYKRK